MYTIKHIEEDGTESTLAVLSVKRNGAQVFAPAPDGVTTYVYGSGRLWIMNEQGKTVGNYDLTHETPTCETPIRETPTKEQHD